MADINPESNLYSMPAPHPDSAVALFRRFGIQRIIQDENVKIDG